MAAAQFRYRAFISYAHADEKWARWLHRSLETYRIPTRLVGQKTEFGPVPARLAPVFRDREELASATDLGAKLTAALEGAATLIVICSRASAQSRWVNEEILAYKRLGRSNRIFSLIVDGEPYSSGVPGEEDNECFPRALRYQIGADGELTQVQAEPIAADARPGKDGKSNARVKLIAGMLGLGFDDLRQRELQRRNRRLAFISVSAVAGMLLAIGLATMAVIARNEAERQRQRAETEAETARQTANFMIDLFAVSDPSEARGKSITAREILTKGAERISTELGGQPRIQTSLMDTIGSVYTKLGLYSDARAMLEDEVALRRQLPDLPAEEYARSLYNLGNVATEQADYTAAGQHYNEALKVLGDSGDSALHIDLNAALAELYFRIGEYKRAEPVLKSVLQERLRLFGPENPAVADAIEELGLNQFDQGRLPEATADLREALALRRKILGDEPHPDIAENINNLALVLSNQANYEEAEKLYEESLAMNHRLYGDSHPSVAIAMVNLAEVYRIRRKFDQAEPLYRQALAMQRKLLGDDHPEVAKILYQFSFNYHDRGQLDQAIATAGEALDIQVRTLGENHPDTARTRAMLGRWQGERGNLDEAETLLRTALATLVEALTQDNPYVGVTRMDLAAVLLKEGRSDEALQEAQLSEAVLTQTLSSEHEMTAVARSIHGAALQAVGDFTAAEPLLLSAYRQLDADKGASPAYRDAARERLHSLYTAWGKPALARQYLADKR